MADSDGSSDLQAALRAALSEGSPQKVRALIEAGADLRYRCDHGYNALLDAVHGRDVTRDPALLELLGLRVLSHRGRFDGVRLLLDAGADYSQLGWTPLMEAVATGTLDDVETALAQGAGLEERDWWDRTAWLIALLTGDTAKASLLRERGADRAACGRCGQPPLFYAIEGHHPEMVRWLLSAGADVHQPNDFGWTALIWAAELDDLAAVEVLLDAGADVEATASGTALRHAESREVIMRLLEAGADPADADHRIILGLDAKPDEALNGVTADEFHRTSSPRSGAANPERMRVPFWEAMVGCGASAYAARQWFEAEESLDEPVWCALRFGQTLTLLPDGRAVQIGGEHEDFYDPDFCIYNDVFVHKPDGSVVIYGYPEAVFPPTDHHTATLIGHFIYLIGSLGYDGTRRYGETPVYRLDVNTLRMDRLATSGEAPGWIHRHRAVAADTHRIRVWGGMVITKDGAQESCHPNSDTYVLDLAGLTWQVG